MKLRVYVVRDSASDAYGTPQFLPAAGQATRAFIDEVNRDAPDNPLFRHSSDFELYFLGTFETDSAVFDCSRPELVVRGLDVRVKS